MHEIDKTSSNSSEAKERNNDPLNASKPFYKSLPVSVWSIIIGVLVCWLGVVAIAAFHPSLNERWKFGADMTLNVLILFVVAFQVYINARQWEVMQEQKRMATVGERAYLGVKEVRLESPIINNTIIVHALIFNGGRTPAMNIQRKFLIGVVEKGAVLPWDKYPKVDDDIRILPAGAEQWITLPHVPLTQTKFQEFEAGKRVIHAAGEISFSDFMGLPQIFRFEVTCESDDNGRFKDRYQLQYDDHAQHLTKNNVGP